MVLVLSWWCLSSMAAVKLASWVETGRRRAGGHSRQQVSAPLMRSAMIQSELADIPLHRTVMRWAHRAGVEVAFRAPERLQLKARVGGRTGVRCRRAGLVGVGSPAMGAGTRREGWEPTGVHPQRRAWSLLQQGKAPKTAKLGKVSWRGCAGWRRTGPALSIQPRARQRRSLFLAPRLHLRACLPLPLFSALSAPAPCSECGGSYLTVRPAPRILSLALPSLCAQRDTAGRQGREVQALLFGICRNQGLAET